MESIKALFLSYFGFEPEAVEPLGVSGSNRKYYRLYLPSGRSGSGAESVIGVEGEDVRENKAFCTIAAQMASKGINVPEVYAVSGDGMCYLQQDLGKDSLYDAVAAGRQAGDYSAKERELLLRTIAKLPKIQFEGAEGLDFSVCHPQTSFGARSIMFDLNYFKYCFLKTSGVEFNEISLQDDLDRLCSSMAGTLPEAFMYRDFQARNVMIYEGEPYFIDFQGGMKGPIYYDLASFIYQAKACYPGRLREELAEAYYNALQTYVSIDKGEFRVNLKKFALLRTLQVLGAYGFRGKFERKQYFIDSIPFAMRNLETLLPEFMTDYPYLCRILSEVISSSKKEVSAGEQDNALEVEITSFSYRKGIPSDRSGNGGGYVFDCRGMHNPGRYEQYRNSTGRDADVIEFLESRGEVTQYMENVFRLVDPHVERYIQRGFSHLMVNFGCTGGQHRSVYCSERLAAHISEKFAGEIAEGRLRINLTHK